MMHCAHLNFYKLKTKLFFLSLVLLIIIEIICSINNPFFLSGIRDFISLLISGYLGYYFLSKFNIHSQNFDIILYILLISSYILISHYKPFYQFYADTDSLEQMSDQFERFHGASPFLIMYLYMYRVLSNQVTKINSFAYLILILVIYYYSQSRTTFIIMLFPSLIYFKNNSKKVWYFAPIILSLAIIFFNKNHIERISELFSINTSTSFAYRLILNSSFIEMFLNTDLKDILFGFGLGAQKEIFIGDYIGYKSIILLDNGYLTSLFKFGIIGSIVIFIFLIKNIVNANITLKTHITLLFPILLTSFSSAHIFTVPLYIMGYLFCLQKLNYEKINY